VIRFIEARYADEKPGLVEANITPWRRAVVGDLTSAFDFAQPHLRPPPLPSTEAYLPPDFVRHDDYPLAVPAEQSLPVQEPGVRRARALPYAPDLQGRFEPTDGSFRIDFGNLGRATLVYQVRSAAGAHAPRCYTVEPQRLLGGSWPLASLGLASYALDVHGPNGFLRAFKGEVGRGARLLVRDSADPGRRSLLLALTNAGAAPVTVQVHDAYGGRRERLRLGVGESVARSWSAAPQRGWYELVVTVDGDPAFEVRLAGHLENGEPSITDPLMGRVRIEGV
jgi:phospholipase C